MSKKLRKPKAHKLPDSTRLQIAKFREENMEISFVSIAADFNCSYFQARKAWNDYRDGKLTQRGKSVNTRKAKRLKHEYSVDELFDEQTHLALGQVAGDDNMNVFDRVNLIDKLSRTAKNVRNMKLEKNLKKTDAGLIAAIIRRFEPEASDERVIQIYREELALWKKD